MIDDDRDEDATSEPVVLRREKRRDNSQRRRSLFGAHRPEMDPTLPGRDPSVLTKLPSVRYTAP